jgi:glycosyltransferase involved in cell wall biosynthesis
MQANLAKSIIPPCILFIGNNFMDKGGYELFLAYKLLQQEWLIIRLDIVSSNIPYRIKQDMIYTEWVTLYTAISDHDLHKLYTQTSIYVMTSHMDTLGWVYYESMSYGIPCIGTDNFSTPELISDGYTWRIVPGNYVSYFDQCYRNLYQNRTASVVICPPEEFVARIANVINELLQQDHSLMKKNITKQIQEWYNAKQAKVLYFDKTLMS